MSHPIIEYYEKIEQVSQKMLHAAKIVRGMNYMHTKKTARF